jgi:nitrogen fixation-related uncharacterized protein
MDDSGQFKDLETHGRQLLLDDDSTVAQADQKGVAASQQTPFQSAMTSSQTEENT